MFKSIIVLVSFVVLAYAQTPVRECGGGLPFVINMRFKDCVEEPCQVVRGQEATSYIRFQAPFSSTVMRPRVRGTWLGITVDVIIPVEQQNGCNHLEADANCPILADNIYDYQFTLAPASNDPLVTAEQEFTMLGDHDQVLFCYRIRNTVVNP